jgi:hypothetical protein
MINKFQKQAGLLANSSTFVDEAFLNYRKSFKTIKEHSYTYTVFGRDTYPSYFTV